MVVLTYCMVVGFTTSYAISATDVVSSNPAQARCRQNSIIYLVKLMLLGFFCMFQLMFSFYWCSLYCFDIFYLLVNVASLYTDVLCGPPFCVISVYIYSLKTSFLVYNLIKKKKNGIFVRLFESSVLLKEFQSFVLHVPLESLNYAWYKRLTFIKFGQVMVGLLASSVVDRGFKPRSGQTKDYEIGICCFSAKHEH